MISESLARRYAVALFRLSKDRNELDKVADEMKVLCDLIKSAENFGHFLYSPKINIDEKKTILANIFKDRFSKTTFHFLSLLVDKKRQTLIENINGQFKTLCDNHHSRAQITVRQAVELEAAVINGIKAEFEKLLNKTITVDQKVDPTLIGGVQVRLDNTVYDASVSGKLQRMRKALA